MIDDAGIFGRAADGKEIGRRGQEPGRDRHAEAMGPGLQDVVGVGDGVAEVGEEDRVPSIFWR